MGEWVRQNVHSYTLQTKGDMVHCTITGIDMFLSVFNGQGNSCSACVQALRNHKNSEHNTTQHKTKDSHMNILLAKTAES